MTVGGNMAFALKLAAGAACAFLPIAIVQVARAQATATQDAPVYEYYQHYDVGYDTSYDDDWFFDYYEFSPAAPDPAYDYYTDYDYESDRFDWEQPEALP